MLETQLSFVKPLDACTRDGLVLSLALLIIASSMGLPLASGKIVEYVIEVEMVDQIAISPDGLYIAAVVESRSVYLLSSEGELIWTKSFKSWVDAVSISGGDHAVIVAAGEEFYLFGLDGTQVWKKTFTDISDAVVSDNGAYIVAAVSDSSSNYFILVMDRGGATLSQSTTWPSKVYLGVSSDAAYIAVGSSKDVILMTRQCKQLWSHPLDSSVGAVAVSSGGFVAVEAYSLSLLDNNGNLLWGGDRETWGSSGVSISGDGKYIASALDGITLLDALGKAVWHYPAVEMLNIEDTAISADGKRVAAAARSLISPGQGRIYILDNPPGTEVVKKPSVLPSKLGCYAVPGTTLIGKSIKIYGSITPNTPSAEVSLKYKKPNGEKFTRTVYTNAEGEYSDYVTIDQIGTWQANATFAGSADLKPSNSTTMFAGQLVEEKVEGQVYQPVNDVVMDVGERRFLKTIKGGSFYYKYNVIDIPSFVTYYGGFTQVFGGDSYIGSTLMVMPWAKPGTYKIRTEWGWSGSPIYTGTFTYTYQLDFSLVVKPPQTKYVTSVKLAVKGKGDTFNATGTTYITVNGYEAPMPGQEVTLTYTRPDGKETTRTVTTSENGAFLDKLKTDAGGSWKVRASLKESESVEAASSETVSFNAEATSPLSQIPIPWVSLIFGVALAIILLGIRRKTSYLRYQRENEIVISIL